MNLNNISTEHMIYGTLFSLCNRIQTLGDSQFKEITIKQHFLLIGLGLFDAPPTLNELSHVVGCSYQNIKRMLNTLEKKEFVKIVQDSNDKRKYRVISQKKVQTFNEENQEITNQFMKSLYVGISKEDMMIALKVLAQMENNVGGFVRVTNNNSNEYLGK